MSTQLAEAELPDLRMVEAIARNSVGGFAELDPEDDRRMPAARGIVTAMLISVPVWALIGFTVYLFR